MGPTIQSVALLSDKPTKKHTGFSERDERERESEKTPLEITK